VITAAGWIERAARLGGKALLQLVVTYVVTYEVLNLFDVWLMAPGGTREERVVASKEYVKAMFRPGRSERTDFLIFVAASLAILFVAAFWVFRAWRGRRSHEV